MDLRLTKWCGICGAAPGAPCMVTATAEGQEFGQERLTPHFYRCATAPPATLIALEPDYIETNPPLHAVEGT